MKHSENIERYQGTLKELARDIVNMRYDSVAKFYEYLAGELKEDSQKDSQRQSLKDSSQKRTQLSKKLEEVAEDNLEIQKKMLSIWDLCKRYMK